MDLITAFKKNIAREHLFTKGQHLLVAVSGGVDSIVLSRLLSNSGHSFTIAHCNFNLRSTESDDDEYFVMKVAQALDVPFLLKKFDTESYANENKLSIQVAARQLRYSWFRELLNDPALKLDKLLTAHHRDDNIETVLMNFFKGSGINGLKGILPRQERTIRPLLFATKEDILEFAVANQIEYREDSSNSSDKYTRNYFRNELIPGLEKVFPQVKNNLARNIERFRDINVIYDNAIKGQLRSLLFKNGDEWQIPVLKLTRTPAFPTILHEIIKQFDFSASQIEEVIKLLSSDSGKFVLSSTHRILHNRRWLIISSLKDFAASVYLIDPAHTELTLPQGILRLEYPLTQGRLGESENVAKLDLKNIRFPLLVRKWKPADYFYPLGMQKKKKVSRFFIDNKLSLTQKEESWIIESDKRVVWIIGQRIDDRFKITDSTAAILKISFLPA